MKKIFSVVVLAVFVFTFVSCIYLHGTNQVFSLEKWLLNVSQFGEITSFLEVTECWTLDYYVNDDGETVYYEGSGTGDTFLEFFDIVRGFFSRLFRSVQLIVESVVDILFNLDLIIPWNASVPREELFHA